MWAPMYVTTIAPRLAGMMIEDKKSLLLPGAWFGLSTLIVLIAFLNLTFAPIGRIIDCKACCGHIRRTGLRLAGSHIVGGCAMYIWCSLCGHR